MIMMGERLENKLFALALYISLINGYVKSGWLMPSKMNILSTSYDKKERFVALLIAAHISLFLGSSNHLCIKNVVE